jgi:crotonobetaine/carnitine-CoA ligase
VLTRYDHLYGTDFSLQAVFSSHAREVPDKVFCTLGKHSLTYAQVESSANRAAHGLRNKLGVGRADNVIVYSGQCAEFFPIMLALHRVGAVYVPTSTRYALDELAYQIGHCEPRAVFTDNEHLEMLRSALAASPDVAPHLIVVDGPAGERESINFEELCSGQADSVPRQAASLQPADLAMIMYTSGTTARPKGVMFSHGNLRVAADNAVQHFRWTPDDKFLHYFPLYHANGGLYGVWPAMLAQASIVMVKQFSASGFGRQLHDYDISFTAVNATHLMMILSNPSTPHDSDHRAWRMMLGLTVNDSDKIIEFEKRFNTRLCPTYGLTESLGISTVGDPVGPRKIGSAGRLVRGLSLRIVDDSGTEVGPGQPGVAEFRSHQDHCLTLGYYKDPELTSQTFQDGWLRSGDILTIDEAGYAHFLDRQKDMIKRSGFNVAPAEIERAVRLVPGVSDVAAVPAPDDLREQAIVAYVTRDDDSLTADEVIRVCSETLADYKVPQVVEFIDELPRDILGKVDRKVLRERALAHHVRSQPR